MFNRLEMSGEETQASETSPKGSDSEVQNGIGLSGITAVITEPTVDDTNLKNGAM